MPVKAGQYTKKAKDITGQKFGRLTALHRVPTPEHIKYSRPFWRCRCDCGKYVETHAYCLKDGRTQSCGCLRDERRATPKVPLGQTGLKYMYSSYRNSALKREITFELTLTDFTVLSKMNCAYCGLPPTAVRSSGSKHSHYIHNGIDRVDNSVGYVWSNVVACCKQCNYGKHKYTEQEFVGWIKRAYEHLFGGK